MAGGILTNEERWKMAGIGVAQSARGAVVDGDEEGGKAIVGGIADEMLVEARNELSGAHSFASGDEHLAAQRRLQAGHQQRGGDSLARNVGNGDGQVRWAKLNQIVIVAANLARCFANRFDLHAGNLRQGSWKQLVLHFARDGDFVFEALALLLLLDERADRTDRKSTRLNSSHANISYAVFCLKKKKRTTHRRCCTT